MTAITGLAAPVPTTGPGAGVGVGVAVAVATADAVGLGVGVPAEIVVDAPQAAATQQTHRLPSMTADLKPTPLPSWLTLLAEDALCVAYRRDFHERHPHCLVAADLIDESAKPWIGTDSRPLEWPATLDLLLASMTEQTLVVSGLGAVVDRAFVRTQRDAIATISDMARILAGLGIPAERAAAEGEWPWEVDDRIHNAVKRGYEALERS